MTVQISNHASRASKSKAFDLVMAIKKGETISDQEKDSLLLHFATTAPKIAKSAEQWCAKAVAKQDARKYLRYLQVRNGLMYGCDGHRIHRAQVDKPDGTYCPKTLLPTETVVGFPFDKADDLLSDKKTWKVNLSDAEDSMLKKWRIATFKHELASISFRKDYLVSALNGSEDEELFVKLSPPDQTSSAYITNSYGKAIIMNTRV